MAKHRRSSNNAAKSAAAASVVVMGTTAVIAQPAQAAEVVVPGTNMKVNVPGIEQVQGINNVPNVEQWIPSLANQGSAASYASVVAPVQQYETQTVGQAILAHARSKIGSPYGWGAAGPNTFDCSGLTSWAYKQVGKTIPRTSYAQAAQGTRVSRENLQPGDIVVFYSGASHVGIYAGNGKVVHALNYGTPLSETSMSTMPFHSAVRF